MAKGFLSLASMAAATAAAAAVLRERRDSQTAGASPDEVTPGPVSLAGSRPANGPSANDPGPDSPRRTAPPDVVHALDVARERLRAEVPVRPGQRDAAPAA